MSVPWTITVHIDPEDREILETADATLAMEQTVYRLIHSLKQAHYERASRNQPLSRGFNGFQK